MVSNTNLEGLITIRGNLQTLDGDFLGAIIAFPYIGNGTNGDWTVAHSGDFTRYDV